MTWANNLVENPLIVDLSHKIHAYSLPKQTIKFYMKGIV